MRRLTLLLLIAPIGCADRASPRPRTEPTATVVVTESPEGPGDRRAVKTLPPDLAPATRP